MIEDSKPRLSKEDIFNLVLLLIVALVLLIYFSVTNKEFDPERESKPEYVFRLGFDEGSGNSVVESVSGKSGQVINPKWVAGISGTALEFGGNSYVKIPREFAIDLGQANIASYRIEAWIKLTKPVTELRGMYNTIISREHDYIIRFANSWDERGRGRIFSTIHFGAGINQHANAYFPGFKYNGKPGYAGHTTSDINLEPNIWYKIALEYKDNQQRLIINDKIVSSTETGINPTTSNYDLYIGSHKNGLDPFVGVIDEVKFYVSYQNS